MAHYSFVTIWRLDTPVASIWPHIFEVEHWPRWWRGVESVTLLRRGDQHRVGARYRYVWKSKLPYRLAFEMEVTHVEPHHRIEGRAQGELEGIGRWTFTEAGQATTVRYDWNVQTTKAWMNALAPLARPLFAWNHDVVMGWGAEGLAQQTGARLLPPD